MKKLFFILCTILLVSCGKNIDVEKDARAYMYKSLSTMANDPSDMEVVDDTTVFKSDSLCIIQYKVKWKNFSTPTGATEVIYYVGEDKPMCVFRDIEYHDPVIKIAEHMCDLRANPKYSAEEQEAMKVQFIKDVALEKIKVEGHEVEDEDEENESEE